MRKNELAAAIAEKASLTNKQAAAAVQAFIDVVGDALANGEPVQLIGFGNFDVAERPERQGINPLTKQPMTVKASKSPRFKAGKALKDKVNA